MMSKRIIILSILILAVTQHVTCDFFNRKKKTKDNTAPLIPTDKKGRLITKKSSSKKVPMFSSFKKKVTSMSSKALFNQRKQCKLASQSIIKEVGPLVSKNSLSPHEIDKWVEEHRVKLEDLETRIAGAQKTLVDRENSLKESI